MGIIVRNLSSRFIMGIFKSLFKRYRYTVTDYVKEYNGIFMYRLSNQKTIEREKQASKKVFT